MKKIIYIIIFCLLAIPAASLALEKPVVGSNTYTKVLVKYKKYAKKNYSEKVLERKLTVFSKKLLRKNKWYKKGLRKLPRGQRNKKLRKDAKLVVKFILSRVQKPKKNEKPDKHPKKEPPKQEPPKKEPPKQEPPKKEPPIKEPPAPEPPSEDPVNNYSWHDNVITTMFWVGEDASEDNGYIANYHSAWDEMWVEHFGGVDNPDSRNGYHPVGFIPKENPFYAAIPYSDFDYSGRRENAKEIPWYDAELAKQWNYSFIKNRWIEIRSSDGKLAYAQLEDAGPYESNDFDYVFRNLAPINTGSALDLSPATQKYLGLTGWNTTSWRFVEADQVPSGPWKEIVTTSDCYWE